LRLGKSAAMPRIAVLIILLVIIIGGLWFLSTLPKQQPTATIEVAVPQGGNAH
jgi:preprotein translocase subunit YajC